MYPTICSERFLVGIYGFKYSRKAIEYAIDLAKNNNSETIGFAVFNLPDVYKTYEKTEKISTISLKDEIRNSYSLLNEVVEQEEVMKANISSNLVNTNSPLDIVIVEYGLV